MIKIDFSKHPYSFRKIILQIQSLSFSEKIKTIPESVKYSDRNKVQIDGLFIPFDFNVWQYSLVVLRTTSEAGPEVYRTKFLTSNLTIGTQEWPMVRFLLCFMLTLKDLEPTFRNVRAAAHI